MDDRIIITRSFYGSWWTSFRKYFYTAWFVYEISLRFYDYALDTQNFILMNVSFHSNDQSIWLGMVLGGLTFVVCLFFLGYPGAIAIYKYFSKTEVEGGNVEKRIIRFL